MKKLLMMVVVVGLLMPAVASAVVVYQNDFGTADQRTIGGTGDWDVLRSPESTIDFSDLVVWNNGWWFNSVDLDGDTIHAGIQAGNGITAGEMWVWKQITLGAGETMSNIVVTTMGWGNGGSNRFGAILSDQAGFTGTFDIEYMWDSIPLQGAGYNVKAATYRIHRKKEALQL